MTEAAKHMRSMLASGWITSICAACALGVFYLSLYVWLNRDGTVLHVACATLLILLLIAYAATTIVEAWWAHRRMVREAAGLCITCAYPQPGPGAACPECGQAGPQRPSALSGGVRRVCLAGIAALLLAIVVGLPGLLGVEYTRVRIVQYSTAYPWSGDRRYIPDVGVLYRSLVLERSQSRGVGLASWLPPTLTTTARGIRASIMLGHHPIDVSRAQESDDWYIDGRACDASAAHAALRAWARNTTQAPDNDGSRDADFIFSQFSKSPDRWTKLAGAGPPLPPTRWNPSARSWLRLGITTSLMWVAAWSTLAMAARRQGLGGTTPAA